MKILKHNNKGILVFDSVRFITSNLSQRFTSKYLQGLDDYHIIITHGVIGELLELIENDCYGLEKSKLSILSNNIETTKYFTQNGFNSYYISEYIFTDDDLYNIKEINKKYDCVFPGRSAKALDLFKTTFKSKLNNLHLNPNYPYPHYQLPSLYNSSKTGLMTTESEGSCLSVGEMLCCGLPIVSVKINNTIPSTYYYPNNKSNYKSTYDIVLPNTLGGRELWLDSSNSIYCERKDESIDKSILELISKDLSPNTIRNNFISKLNMQRLNFLYLLKSIFESLSIPFDPENMDSFITMPYGNSTVSSTEWKTIIQHFKYSYLKNF